MPASTTSDDRPVTFLVAGVQKGGTTALFRHLAEHPGLNLAACKEAHFFDDEVSVEWSDPDYAPYHALFEPRPGCPWGEATPIYIYWPNSLERIARYSPAMRLILCFREPRSRAWSHWRMETARGDETEPFAWCIRDGRARVGSDPQARGAHRVFSYIERGFYATQLEALYARFPRAQVLCLRSEDLKQAPQRTLDRVCDFLQVERMVIDRPIEANVGRDDFTRPDPADLRYMAELFAPEMQRFSALSGLDVEGWVRGSAS